MELLKTELHCHNEFSNFHLGKLDTPYDCNVTIQDQFEKARTNRLDVMFVTNHNTLEGYEQMLQYQKDHPKYQGITIYPAEEITTDQGAHVLAYGIYETIPAGLSFGEIVDEIKKQSGISSAPHPFSLLDAVRDKAKQCDLIEVFNSNNIDVFSNTKATIFADQNNMTCVAGSDSHVLSTLGKCVNVIESENNLDSILASMRHNRIKILSTGYATAQETLDHLRYKIENSTEYIFDYVSQFYPKSVKIFSVLHKMYQRNPNSYLWILFYKFAIFALKRISQKINFQNYNPNSLKERNLATAFKLAF